MKIKTLCFLFLATTTLTLSRDGFSLDHDCREDVSRMIDSELLRLSAASADPGGLDTEALTAQFFEGINEERRKDALESEARSCKKREWKLERKADLDAIAKGQCAFMASKITGKCEEIKRDDQPGMDKYMACIRLEIKNGSRHKDDAGKDEGVRAREAGVCKGNYQICEISANISAVFRPKVDPGLVADIVKKYMESPGHRANILQAYINQTGVALCEVQGQFIFTSQVFAERRPKGVKPNFDEPIKDCVPKKSDSNRATQVQSF